MPDATTFGPFFTQVIPYPIPGAWPVIELGRTQEIEWPYRWGHSLVIRLPLHKALVIGAWQGEELDEDKALFRAMNARNIKEQPDVQA